MVAAVLFINLISNWTSCLKANNRVIATPTHTCRLKIADAMHFLLASLSFFGLNFVFVKATTRQGEYLASKIQFNSIKKEMKYKSTHSHWAKQWGVCRLFVRPRCMFAELCCKTGSGHWMSFFVWRLCIQPLLYQSFLCPCHYFSFVLKYSWFTMLWYFQMYSKVIQLYIYYVYMYIFFRFFSVIGYCNILNIVVCAI